MLQTHYAGNREATWQCNDVGLYPDAMIVSEQSGATHFRRASEVVKKVSGACGFARNTRQKGRASCEPGVAFCDHSWGAVRPDLLPPVIPHTVIGE
jgi:hypothetical protein